jgi:myo-inositol 2-dehydrogenase / D-chiro-inositol 1-dehydrogenase
VVKGGDSAKALASQRALARRARPLGSRPIGVGVIGAGLMGSTHARLLATAVAGAEVVAISDAVHELAEHAAAALDVSTIHADGIDLIGDPAVDAVVIASPAATHEAYALACIDAGKPALCEKPLATSAAAVDVTL